MDWEQEHAPEAQGEYAGFWRRAAAYLIDSLVLGISGIVIGAVFAGLHARGLGNLVVIVVGLLYFPLQEASAAQATLGKRALGIYVTDEQGRRISAGRAFGRYLGKILSGLIIGIGYLMVAFTRRKQGLHDKLAHTLVLRREAGSITLR